MKEDTYHHGDLENELIEAGIRLISEEGIKGFSLRKVATACSVSHAAPYSHFKDVDALIRAMGRHVTERFTEKLRAAIQGQEDSPNAVPLLGRAYISFFIENPHYLQFLFYHSGLTIDLDGGGTEDYPPFALFKEAACRLFDHVGLPEDEQLKTLIALWSMVHGISSLLTNKGIRYSGDWVDVLTGNGLFGRHKQ